MKIQEQDLFHGAALIQVIEYADQVIVQKVQGEYGLYRINRETNLMLKYRTHRNPPWRFIFSENEMELMRKRVPKHEALFLVLVCSNATICALSKHEFEQIIDLSATGDQWVSVFSGHGKSLWVSGPRGELSYSIRHNDFPKKLFEHVKTGGN